MSESKSKIRFKYAAFIVGALLLLALSYQAYKMQKAAPVEVKEVPAAESK